MTRVRIYAATIIRKIKKTERRKLFLSIRMPAGACDRILNHVSIDRFTGGAISGALFNEEALFAGGAQFTMEILVRKDAAAEDPDILKAFENALDDACSGILPLGGGVNRGNGTFRGSWKKE